MCLIWIIVIQVEGKTLPEVTEFYYYWKKYCNDEYRGRNRHISEEVLVDDMNSHICNTVLILPQIMSDEDLAGPQSHSSDSSSSSSSSEVEAAATSSALSSHPPSEIEKQDKAPRKSRGETNVALRPPMGPPFDLPIVYAPHSSRAPRGAPVQQYKCKYPGCTQVCVYEY